MLHTTSLPVQTSLEERSAVWCVSFVHHMHSKIKHISNRRADFMFDTRTLPTIDFAVNFSHIHNTILLFKLLIIHSTYSTILPFKLLIIHSTYPTILPKIKSKIKNSLLLLIT